MRYRASVKEGGTWFAVYIRSEVEGHAANVRFSANFGRRVSAERVAKAMNAAWEREGCLLEEVSSDA